MVQHRADYTSSTFRNNVSLLACFMVLAGFATVLGAGPCSVAPSGLTCEYLKDPLGLDVQQPRLGWQLTATNDRDRGQRQNAYQIIVASTASRLDQGRGDLWDPGFVKSNQSMLVPYKGKPLQSGQVCYWKVRVRDESARTSAWSQPASWSMGLLQSQDWTAQWIGSDRIFERKQGWPPPDNDVPDPWLRKGFELSAKPERATIYIASVGYHELYVNGKKVGDAVLSPSVVNYRKRARYVTYEIADYLQQGRNAIGLWLGVSWSIFPQYKRPDRPQTPMVLAQADIQLTDGQTLRIATNEQWRIHPSPNRLLGVWDFMHFGGEEYDARKEIPGWADSDFDDRSWEHASVYKPSLQLSAEKIEPNRRIQEIRPVAIEEVKPKVYRVDLGTTVDGLLELDVEGEPGDIINIKFSERSTTDMTHRLYSRYIIGSSGRGTFRNRFNYFNARWITLEGLRSAPTLNDIRTYLVRTDFKRTSKFRCSNDLLNWIYDTTLWTYENLSLGGYVVDCSQRERMGYGGDGHATTECGLNNYNLGAFYTKWSEDWRDVQGGDSAWGTAGDKAATKDTVESGNLPYTAPTYWGGGGPAWSGFCVTLPWELYERYGDKRILTENLDTIQRWLAFLEGKAKDNMLQRWGGKWDFLGDWLWPGAEGVNGDTIETLFFNNCYWIFNLQTAAKIAEVIGDKKLAAQYQRRAEEVRQAVHRTYFQPETNSYVNGFQGYLAIALLVGLPPGSLRDAVWKRLEEEILITRKGHIHAGITAGAFLYKTLLGANRQDLLFTMANKDTYPGWGLMRRNNATAIWESWDMRNSLCHSSYLYVGTWFIEGLAGIQSDPERPGFQYFVIRPGVVDDPSLSWVKAEHESLYGRIESTWTINNDRLLNHRVAVPPNTSATLYLPTTDEKSLSEGGRPLDGSPGLKHLDTKGGYAIIKLSPGRYQFESKLAVVGKL